MNNTRSPELRRTLAGACVLLALLGAATVRAAGTLTVCTESAPEGFDVTQYTSSVVNDAAGQTIYEQLLGFKRGTVEVVPALAERWAVSADGLQYTLYLRRGVRFHTTPWFTPTREMNADDVMFSIRRLMDRDSPWRKAAPNGFTAWDSYGPAYSVKAIDKLDDMTVRLTLSRPAAPFLINLAQFNTASVYSAEYGEQLLKSGKLEALNTQPVGTGPFVFKSYQKDAVLRFAPHPAYWGGASTLDGLVFAITPDANVRAQRLKAGECLVGVGMRAETIGAFDGTDVKASGMLGLPSGYIPLNTKRAFLSDRRFREALALAFDKTSFIRSVYGGKATPSATFVPPTVWGHDATLAERHDIERARALVKASGYDGRGFAILARIGGGIDGKRAAELMQADWARIGVKTTVQMIDWGELLKRLSAGDYDITFLSWIGGGDPDGYFTPILTCAAVAGGNNDAQWCNPAFDEVVGAARASNDRAERIELYRKAQRILYDELPIIPTVYPMFFIAVNKRVHGFVNAPDASLDFRGVSLD
jgi:dipeptide transport system substrate-binding protein